MENIENTDVALKAKMEEILPLVKKVNEVVERNEKRIDALDEQQIQRLSGDMTKLMDDMNVIQANQKAAEDERKNLEKIIARPSQGASHDDEENIKLKTAYNQFLKTGHLDSDPKAAAQISYDICKKVIDSKLLYATDEQKEKEIKSMVVGSNPRGGYFVHPEMANWMIKRIFETSPMRQIANVVNIGTDALDISIDDNEVDCGWVGEVDARPDTNTPDVGELKIFAHTMYARPKISEKMLEDSVIDVASWLQQKIASRFARKENNAFVVGDGSKKPRGFLDYPAWTTLDSYERGALETFDSKLDGAFDLDSLSTLIGAVKEDYQSEAVWVMNRRTWTDVLKLKDNEDRPFINPQLLSQGAQIVLYGKPVVFFDDMPVPATDSKSIAYGSFKDGYTVIDRIGIQIRVDDLTRIPFISYYTRKRVGGDVTNYESIKVLKLSV
ncbi:MAG: phage major capsid protein [Candidatus Peribacteraceae bacterium]|nr:phage major capsid protein [Candidatus Peribacteraceae bacterium]